MRNQLLYREPAVRMFCISSLASRVRRRTSVLVRNYEGMIAESGHDPKQQERETVISSGIHFPLSHIILNYYDFPINVTAGASSPEARIILTYH